MNRIWVLTALLLTGCSTAPLADFLDFFAPGRLPPGAQLQQQGGVCLPQGGLPGVSGVAVIPGPGALPGEGPPVTPGAVPAPPGVPGPGVAPPGVPGAGVPPVTPPAVDGGGSPIPPPVDINPPGPPSGPLPPGGQQPVPFPR